MDDDTSDDSSYNDGDDGGTDVVDGSGYNDGDNVVFNVSYVAGDDVAGEDVKTVQ